MNYKEFLVLLLGITISIGGTGLYQIYLDYTYGPKYKVGDCLSNGLFFEKILDIRKPKVHIKDPQYVMQAYFGLKTDPDPRISTTYIWIVDKDYTKVDSKYCTINR